MTPILSHSPVQNPEDITVSHILIPAYEPLHTSNESREFPGETIRVKHQLVVYTEDCIAAGCPDGLW